MRKLSRRSALQRLIGLYGAQRILGAQQAGSRDGGGLPQAPPMDDPLLRPVNVTEFGELAQKNLDPAAWDYLEAPSLHDTGIVYFGSLAQRHAVSRAAIRAAVKRAPGPRFLDLNLRPGTDTPGLAAEVLMLADWVKLNEDELDCLLAWFEPTLPALMDRFALQGLVLTRGAAGCALYGEQGRQLVEEDGATQPAFVDSVGAGDAFTALLLGGMTLGLDLAATLRLANRYAAMICGVRGPLPADPATLAPWRAALHALPDAGQPR